MRLLHDKSLMVDLWRPDGYTKSGIYVQHHKGVMTPYGKVSNVHPSCSVRVGDFVVFKKYAPQPFPHDGDSPYFLWEWQILAVLTRHGGAPWFITCE